MATVLDFTVVPYGDPAIGTYNIQGSGVRISLRKEIAPILVGFMIDFVKQVEPLDPKTCGGHNPRKITGSSSWSRHAPGIAVDLNWAKHPQGRSGTFTSGQVKAIRRLLAKYSYQGVPLIRWGGDYSGRKDEMHYELNVARSVALKAVAALQTPVKPKPPPPVRHPAGSRLLRLTTPPMDGADVLYVQKFIGSAKCGAADGEYGPKTRSGVMWYQKMRGLDVDGIVGRNTWRQMGVSPSFN